MIIKQVATKNSDLDGADLHATTREATGETGHNPLLRASGQCLRFIATLRWLFCLPLAHYIASSLPERRPSSSLPAISPLKQLDRYTCMLSR